jgi:hypothetical protein
LSRDFSGDDFEILMVEPPVENNFYHGLKKHNFCKNESTHDEKITLPNKFYNLGYIDHYNDTEIDFTTEIDKENQNDYNPLNYTFKQKSLENADLRNILSIKL